MFVGSPVGSIPSSPLPAHTPSPQGQQSDSDAPEDPPPDPALLSLSLPCWATQALCDLARRETDLRRLRERQAAETVAVNRGAERAILGARREERRLLERVEQDHRDTQLRLEQLQRENAAAARVSQALLDQRLRKLALFREQIQQQSGQRPPGLDQSGPDQNPLLKGVTELLQPWEISLSLKKVSFKPSSQPKAVTFGEIRIQEHDLCLPVGGCGPQGRQLCPLHSGEMQCVGDASQGGGAGEERSTPDGAAPGQGVTSPTGRVVRKIRLSAQSDKGSGEEDHPKHSSSSRRHWPPRHEPSDRESSQDEETEESPASEPPRRQDLFSAAPAVLSNGDSEGEELGYKRNGRRYSLRNQKKPRATVPASGREPTPSCERGILEHVKLSQRWGSGDPDGDRGRKNQDCSSRGDGRPGYSTRTSSKMTTREPLASQSCLDLTSREHPRSHRLSQSSDDHPPGDSGGRAPSPADSLDSCYTFIVSSPRDRAAGTSLNHDPRRSKSTADLTRKTRPLINSVRRDSNTRDGGAWRVNRSGLASSSASPPPPLSRRPRASSPCPGYRDPGGLHQSEKRATVGGHRSLSMSVIDGSSSQESNRGRGERGEPALVEMEEEGDPSTFLHRPAGEGHLVRQFGKQGSGRSDLTLPSGVHATPQGQLFIVDCGNARVQVSDPQGNVLQQVASPTSDGSARRCRNYFDVAVNSKGLVALSCAAERALLVFNRHGRLLQTFGGSGTGQARDQLEAPRGMTVTRLDEFLVADIRRGTLVSLRLDPKTGCRLERTVVTGFHRPYLVAACLSSGMVAVSERGSETGREPCVKVLEPGWNTVRVLGVCSGMGPVLTCPWGICIDGDGNVLVADWGEEHRVVLYPAHGVGWPVVTQGLSSPRGLALLPEGHLVVSDSMHHCVKIYRYK